MKNNSNYSKNDKDRRKMKEICLLRKREAFGTQNASQIPNAFITVTTGDYQVSQTTNLVTKILHEIVTLELRN